MYQGNQWCVLRTHAHLPTFWSLSKCLPLGLLKHLTIFKYFAFHPCYGMSKFNRKSPLIFACIYTWEYTDVFENIVFCLLKTKHPECRTHMNDAYECEDSVYHSWLRTVSSYLRLKWLSFIISPEYNELHCCSYKLTGTEQKPLIWCHF